MDEARKSNWLSDLFRRSPRAANTPVIPQPPYPSVEERLLPGIEPVERHYQQEFVEIMNVSLTPEERAFVANGNELVTYETKPRGVAGCGCVVTGIGENGNQKENRIVGFCRLCFEEAQKLVAKGALPPDQIGWYASYCRNCEAKCGHCRRKTCAQHTPDSLCPECQVTKRREKLVWAPIEGIASLFIRITPQLPPGRSEDDC